MKIRNNLENNAISQNLSIGITDIQSTKSNQNVLYF